MKVVSESIKHKVNFHLRLHFEILVTQSKYDDLGLAPDSQKLGARSVEAALEWVKTDFIALYVAKGMVVCFWLQHARAWFV